MNKKISIGVCGGIAIYKICELISLLKKANIESQVIMTKSACEFVSPLLFKTISCNQVYTDAFNYSDIEPLHIKLAMNSDLFLIAPATASIIGKIANGISDDLLSSTVCAFNKKLLIAPSMNVNMWNNPITQKNIQTLKEFLKVEIIEPEEGNLACGKGVGRLSRVEVIFENIKKNLI